MDVEKGNKEEECRDCTDDMSVETVTSGADVPCEKADEADDDGIVERDADGRATAPIGVRLEQTLSSRSVPLARTITGRSNAGSWIDPGPPPDGGAYAWMQTVLIHLMTAVTFGFITSFGVFQTYYTTDLHIDPSTVSWIGALQIFLLFFIGTFSGRCVDAGLFRPIFVAGCVLMLVGVFCTSAATKLWQIILAQGLCTGLGNGLQFCSAMSLLSHYFKERRSFATGIASLGSCTGGIIFPIIVQQMLPKAGFPWTIRTCGFVMVAISALNVALLRPRLPPRKTGPLVEWSAFKEAPYVLFVAGMFFNFWALYFAFFYVGTFGRTKVGFTYSESINLILILSAIGVPFRTVPAYFADKTGPLNMMIPFAYGSGIMMFGWIGIKTRANLYVFAVLYGITAAGIQALFPAALASLTSDVSKSGTRLGMGFSIVSIACLTGPPIAGALIEVHGGLYDYAQIWAGLSFFVGASLLLTAKIARGGWDIKSRI